MNNYTIRKAQMSDSRKIWNIRNDDSNRFFSDNPEKIDFKKHQIWLKNYLEKNNGFFLVLTDEGGTIIGYIRFDKKDQQTLVISIALQPKFQGKGLGSHLLSKSLKSYKNDLYSYTIIAKVKLQNLASQKLFEKNNFLPIDKDTTHMVYQYHYTQ